MFKKLQKTLFAASIIGMSLCSYGADEILVGVHAPIQTSTGKNLVNGAQYAVDEINKDGGVLGRKLKIVVEDETENPQQGVNAIKKLISSNVDVLVGGYASGVTLAQMPHVSKAKIVDMISGSSAPQITKKVTEDYDNYKYYFRAGVLNSVKLGSSLVDLMVGFLNKEQGFKKFAIVGEQAAWVQQMIPHLKDQAEKNGLEIVYADTFSSNETNLLPILKKVENSGAQFMVVILAHGPSDALAKQWRDAKIKVPYGGIDVKAQDSSFPGRVGGASVSEIYLNFMTEAPISEKTLPFYNGFKGKFGEAPVYTGAGAYDGIYAYVEAVKRAKSLDADAVIKELEKTSMVSTIGRMEFDEGHDLKSGKGLVEFLYLQTQDDLSTKIVWPKSMRNGDPIKPIWMR